MCYIFGFNYCYGGNRDDNFEEKIVKKNFYVYVVKELII